ncbi:hypothetical protein SEA_JACOREN57_52 [Mycobacterium phage JacoRen57]|nr:hypothetical protein SEA_JACOREN57_52 [Mycobacterium phage JacoRen57]
MTIKVGSYVRLNEFSKVYKVLEFAPAGDFEPEGYTALVGPAPEHPDGTKRDRTWAKTHTLIEVELKDHS